VTIDTEKAESMFCKDWFLFATEELQHVETFFFSGNHQITFKNLNADTKADILKNGIRIYMFCDGYVDTFISAWHTVICFLGGLGPNPYIPIFGSHVPEYMEKANVNFLSEVMNYTLEVR
jgi:hypothetical protein